MQVFNLFGKAMVSMAVIMMFGNVNAAETGGGRGSMMPTTNVSRMPTVPVVGTMSVVGNPAVTVTTTPTAPAQQTVVVTPTPTPTPEPKPGETKPVEPKPVAECEDGGVKKSKYTVSACMDDLKSCVNNGALQGGINDLFNEDVRNSIFAGMRLCQSTVDKCVASVRLNCRNVYNDSNDVWLDFNSRVVQPEYYNFVLRRTGLSPNQAENTCLLLDRNTYGASFTSVSDLDVVKAEYQKKVGAYNGADGRNISKNNPLGAEVNTIGYDGKRGHYARWDAANAECLVRVGAYNKDTAIKNSWLFGAVGNDNVAEVWKPVGSTFTCNKDLFGFSLFNDTKTAAVVGITGGAVVGAGVGAGIGAGMYNSQQAKAKAGKCSDEKYRTALAVEIHNKHQNTILYDYVCKVEQSGKETVCTRLLSNDDFRKGMTEDVCRNIENLYSVKNAYNVQIERCETDEKFKKLTGKIAKGTNFDNFDVGDGIKVKGKYYPADNGGDSCVVSPQNEGDEAAVEFVKSYTSNCLFKPIKTGVNVACNDTEHGCMPLHKIKQDLNTLSSALGQIKSVVDPKVTDGAKKSGSSKGAMIGKGAAIGAATGVGVGGIATAITAFVERSNINCRVGDGLNSVAFGKSHTIDTLKDFYVKWNLQLPDTVTPTSVVTDVASWEQACAQFNNKLYDCPNVQINYRKDGKNELIAGACKISGSVCVINDSVALSWGEDEEEVEAVLHRERPEHHKEKPHHEKPKEDNKHHDDIADIDDGWYGGVGGGWDVPGGSYTEKDDGFIKFPPVLEQKEIDTERIQHSLEVAEDMLKNRPVLEQKQIDTERVQHSLEAAENMWKNGPTWNNNPIWDGTTGGDPCPSCYKQNPSLDLIIKPGGGKQSSDNTAGKSGNVGTIKPVKPVQVNSGSFQKLGN